MHGITWHGKIECQNVGWMSFSRILTGCAMNQSQSNTEYILYNWKGLSRREQSRQGLRTFRTRNNQNGEMLYNKNIFLLQMWHLDLVWGTGFDPIQPLNNFCMDISVSFLLAIKNMSGEGS